MGARTGRGESECLEEVRGLIAAWSGVEWRGRKGAEEYLGNWGTRAGSGCWAPSPGVSSRYLGCFRWPSVHLSVHPLLTHLWQGRSVLN